jgi:hypothetical protein
VKPILLLLAVALAGCTDPCAQVAAAGIQPIGQTLYKRAGGVSIGAFFTSTPVAAGVVVSNDCNSLGSASQMLERSCAPLTSDDGCAACLRAKCCALALEWLYGADAGAGPELAACVEASCSSPCTRTQ